jgi:hypothetical protein
MGGIAVANALEETIRELSRRAKRLAPKYLYHYTNGDGLLGICGNREIWFGDVRFMNDPSELHFGETAARDALEAFEDTVAEGGVRPLIEEALGALRDGAIAMPLVFAFSLCRQGDNLNHWREYADRGRGYSVAFHAKALLELSSSALGLFRVRYNKPDQDEIFHYFYSQIAKNLTADPLSLDRVQTLKRVATGVAVISAIMKNKSYETEAEWRVVIAAPATGHKDIKFIARKSSIKPYIPRKLGQLFGDDVGSSGSAVASITLGPALEPVVTASINIFLASQKLALEVKRSVIPVRDLM